MSVVPESAVHQPSRGALVSRAVIVSVWAVPVLVAGQFAMLAVLPVVLVLIGTFSAARLRAFRAWALALGVVYAVPLVLRATGPDPGLSLSRSMGPVLTAVVVSVSVVVALAFHVLARRRRSGAGVSS